MTQTLSASGNSSQAPEQVRRVLGLSQVGQVCPPWPRPRHGEEWTKGPYQWNVARAEPCGSALETFALPKADA